MVGYLALWPELVLPCPQILGSVALLLCPQPLLVHLATPPLPFAYYTCTSGHVIKLILPTWNLGAKYQLTLLSCWRTESLSSTLRTDRQYSSFNRYVTLGLILTVVLQLQEMMWCHRYCQSRELDQATLLQQGSPWYRDCHTLYEPCNHLHWSPHTSQTIINGL